MLQHLITPPLITQASNHAQFIANGSRIQRFNDRVMIADAAVNDGAFPNVTKDWLSTFQTSQAGGPANGTILGCTFGVLCDQTVPGLGGALLGGARSLNATNAGQNVIVGNFFAVNDSPTFGTVAWALYSESHRVNNTVAGTVGYEIDVVQRGSLQQMTPYALAGGETTALKLAAGAGLSATGQFAATAACVIGANPMAFDKGIVVLATSISGTNGVTGTGYAISLAKGHVIQYWATGGVPTGSIVGSGTTSANAVSINLGENVMTFAAQNGLNLLTLTGVASAVNSLNISHGATGNPVNISTVGGDANVDLGLIAAGTGTVRFNSAGMFAANGAVNTAMSALGPAGASTTIRKWLQIKDNAGGVFFIPCF